MAIEYARFLARRAARNPDTHHVRSAFPRQDRRNRDRFQRGERRRVAKEFGHADQQFAEERLHFVGILAQRDEVVGRRGCLPHLHATLHATDQRLRFVLAEVVPHLRAQHVGDLLQVRREVLSRSIGTLLVARGKQVLAVCEQPLRHRLHRQHLVDQSRGGGAGRHAAHGDMVETCLRHGEAAVLLDRPQPARAVAARARQHDADRAVALVFSQRGEERIDGPSILPWRRWLADLQHPVVDGQGRIGRDHVHLPGLDDHSVRRLEHGHRGMPAQQVHQHAFVLGRQVLHEHEGHVGVGGHAVEEPAEGLQPACGGADADDQRRRGCRRGLRRPCG